MVTQAIGTTKVDCYLDSLQTQGHKLTAAHRFDLQVVCPLMGELSGPLDRLNAILSLLQPLDRYRAPSAIESAIGKPYLALSRIHAQVGVLNRLVLNRLGGSTTG